MTKMDPPVLGSFCKEEEEIQTEQSQQTERDSQAQLYADKHLCLTCVHESVCAVVSAVRAVRAEGLIVISSCGLFSDGSEGLEELAKSLEEGETDGD